MATLANIFDRVLSAGAVAEREARTSARELSDAYRLRTLPNEDIYFFTKRIDNSRVVRQADPAASARSWKILGGASLSATLLICALLPSAYGLMAGYQVHTLEQENRHLVVERARLDSEESQLTSAKHLKELADKHELQTLKPESVVFLTPKNDASLAFNRQH